MVSTPATSGPPPSRAAEEVDHYTRRTLGLVTEWMSRGAADAEAPACRWESSEHLAKARKAGGAAAAETSTAPLAEDQLFAVLAQTLEDSVNPWTGRFLDKLYAAPTTLSPAIDLLLAALNASPAVSSAAPALCLAEEQTVARLAGLLGWDAGLSDGLTMPGGSASNVLAVQTALGNAFPSFKSGGILGVADDLSTLHGRRGRAARPLLLTSEQSHYSLEKAALACGMGLDSVVKVRCDDRGRMDMSDLQRILAETEANVDGSQPAGTLAGFPFFVNATSGTTILGAFDDLAAVVATCRRSPTRIWVHADCSWGGPVMFSSISRHLMAGVEGVDSLTMNPHKILNITQQCSFALFRDGTSLGVNVTAAKYLFHGAQDDDKPSRAYLCRNPGAKTMGCARRADAFKFYVEWLRAGTSGLEAHLERGIDHARQVIQLLHDVYPASLELSAATPEPVFLQVCMRPRPPPSLLALLDPLLADMAADEQTTPTLLRYRLLSSAAQAVHATLRSVGKYQVDKAPVYYPRGSGYYIRLVTHPNTPFAVFKGLIAEVDGVGRAFFQQLEGRLQGAEGQASRGRKIIAPLVEDGE